MPLTRPIPKAAMPIIEIIRRDVPRPSGPPTWVSRGRLRWRTPRGFACLLGLHPECVWTVPFYTKDFRPLVKDRAFEGAVDWFDEQDDPEAVMDAVWPQEEEPCR